MNVTFLFRFFILGLIFISFFSCNTEDISEITAIEVTHDGQPQVILNGDIFVFQVKANNNTDKTSESHFEVDGVALDGNTFITNSEPKAYNVQAFYNDIESQSILVFGSDGYKKNVLIEDYTGTWCGNCPRVSYAIEQVKLQTDQVVSVAIHVLDDYAFDGSIAVNDEFGITSYPNARLNRIHKWTAPEPDNITEAVNLTGLAPLGIAISSDIIGNSLSVTTKVEFSETITDPLKLVVYVVENGLIQDQENYTSYFGGEAIIFNFEHNDVLRAIYTNHLGDIIPSSEVIEDNVYTIQVEENIPTTVENFDYLHLVSFVVNANTNEVVNVREAAIGETQEFE